MKIGICNICKNEVDYIGYSVMSVLPYVDEIVYADGNSTDGTLELLDHIKRTYDQEGKIRVYTNMDCADLRDDYNLLVNKTLRLSTCDWLIPLHQDMIVTNGDIIRGEVERLADEAAVIGVGIRSYCAADKLILGRSKMWGLIFRNAHDLHFNGVYGSGDEGFIHRDIVGDGNPMLDWANYPEPVAMSGVVINHLCEYRPYQFRRDKMLKVVRNVRPDADADLIASVHPRVTLEEKYGYAYESTDISPFGEYAKYHDEFAKFRRDK